MSNAAPRGSRPQRSPILPRDTEITAFTLLLSDLIQRIPGARAAALVDRDGESIDYAGALSPFDVKIAAAHWQIVLGELGRLRQLEGANQIVARGAQKSFIVRALADAYAVVVVLAARAGFASSTRAFAVFERDLSIEAGIGSAQTRTGWTPVTVQQDSRARPATLTTLASSTPQTVEVLGAVMGLGRGERGFRVRLAGGFETTMVREPGGVWYTDEPIDDGPQPARR